MQLLFRPYASTASLSLRFDASVRSFARFGRKKAKEEAKAKKIGWSDFESETGKKLLSLSLKAHSRGTFNETFILANATVKRKIYRGGINHLLVGN